MSVLVLSLGEAAMIAAGKALPTDFPQMIPTNEALVRAFLRAGVVRRLGGFAASLTATPEGDLPVLDSDSGTARRLLAT